MSTISRMLIIGGFILILLGVIFHFASRAPWLGRLPGDIYIKKDNLSFYFPLTTSIIIGIIVSFVLYLLGKK